MPRENTVFPLVHDDDGLIHASAVKLDVFHAVATGTRMRDAVPLNEAAVCPVGETFDAPPKVTDVATPATAALPVPAAVVEPAASFSAQYPTGLSAATAAAYAADVSLPESGRVPAESFVPPGAEARLPDVEPAMAKNVTTDGVPLPVELTAYTRYQ